MPDIQWALSNEELGVRVQCLWFYQQTTFSQEKQLKLQRLSTFMLLTKSWSSSAFSALQVIGGPSCPGSGINCDWFVVCTLQYPSSHNLLILPLCCFSFCCLASTWIFSALYLVSCWKQSTPLGPRSSVLTLPPPSSVEVNSVSSSAAVGWHIHENWGIALRHSTSAHLD